MYTIIIIIKLKLQFKERGRETEEESQNGLEVVFLKFSKRNMSLANAQISTFLTCSCHLPLDPRLPVFASKSASLVSVGLTPKKAF